MRNDAARALRDDEHWEAAPVRRLRLVGDDGDHASIQARRGLSGASANAERRVARVAADPGREADHGSAYVEQQADYRPTYAPNGRRNVRITGQPQPRRRRSATVAQIESRPDRLALWAVLLGLFLVFMAAATANAAPL